MSLYTEWVNTIKTRAQINWLTTSQKEAFNCLVTRWHSQQFINLSGPPGCGKSFIARLLVKEYGYVYTHTLEDVPDGSKNVIVDDAYYQRFMRSQALDKDIKRVILITQSPVNEAMPLYKLSLTSSDIAQFEKALSTYCQIYFKFSIPEGNDLEKIILQEVQKRGEQHHEH